MNMTVLISLLDLEKCIFSNSMLKKMATIWASQLYVTRFVLKLCIFEAFISFYGCISRQTHLVGFLLWITAVRRYNPLLNGIPYFCIQKRATNQSWVLLSPVVRMWHEKADGTPKLSKDVLALVSLRPL